MQDIKPLISAELRNSLQLSCWGWRDTTEVLAFHVVDPDSIPNTTYDPLNTDIYMYPNSSTPQKKLLHYGYSRKIGS